MIETTKAVKAPNYTPAMTAVIVAAYTASATKDTVAALATQFGKTTRSIVAKLSREGVYKKTEYVAKNGAKPETKEAKVARIAVMIGVDAEKLSGLEAATKGTLDLIAGALKSKVAADADAAADAMEAMTHSDTETETGDGDVLEGNAATA